MGKKRETTWDIPSPFSPGAREVLDRVKNSGGLIVAAAIAPELYLKAQFERYHQMELADLDKAVEDSAEAWQLAALFSLVKRQQIAGFKFWLHEHRIEFQAEPPTIIECIDLGIGIDEEDLAKNSGELGKVLAARRAHLN